jgi:hypothetical protein
MSEHRLTRREADILSFFSRHMTDVAFTAEEIATACEIDDNGTFPKVRYAIRKLNEAGYPIVSSTAGFFFTADEEALYHYRLRLYERAEAIMVRAHMITHILKELTGVKA